METSYNDKRRSKGARKKDSVSLTLSLSFIIFSLSLSLSCVRHLVVVFSSFFFQLKTLVFYFSAFRLDVVDVKKKGTSNDLSSSARQSSRPGSRGRPRKRRRQSCSTRRR